MRDDSTRADSTRDDSTRADSIDETLCDRRRCVWLVDRARDQRRHSAATRNTAAASKPPSSFEKNPRSPRRSARKVSSEPSTYLQKRRRDPKTAVERIRRPALDIECRPVDYTAADRRAASRRRRLGVRRARRALPSASASSRAARGPTAMRLSGAVIAIVMPALSRSPRPARARPGRPRRRARRRPARRRSLRSDGSWRGAPRTARAGVANRCFGSGASARAIGSSIAGSISTLLDGRGRGPWT